jgi:hypothetical protein
MVAGGGHALNIESDTDGGNRAHKILWTVPGIDYIRSSTLNEKGNFTYSHADKK